MTAPKNKDMFAELLHWPARKERLLGLDEHLNHAATLARALWPALQDVQIEDPRDAAALQNLASRVADHTSAAEYVFDTCGGGQ